MRQGNAPGEMKIVPMMHCDRVGFLPTDLPFGVSLGNLPELMRVLRPLPCAFCGGKHAISVQLGRVPATKLRVVLRLKVEDGIVHTVHAGWVECDQRGNVHIYDERKRATAELPQSVKDWWFEAEASV